MAMFAQTSMLLAQPLVVGFFDFPPLLYFDESNQIKGRVVDELLQPIGKNSELEFVYKRYPPKRFYSEVARGNIDLCFVSKGSPVVDLVHFSSEPILRTRISLFAKQSIIGIKDVTDIVNGRIGGLRGFEYLGRVKRLRDSSRGRYYHAVNNRDSLYRLLDSGRIQYAMDYGTPAQRHIELNYSEAFNEFPLEVMLVYLVIPKSKQGAIELLTRIEGLLEHELKPSPL